MTQRVPSWDLEDVNPNHDIYKLDYEVAELTWENGQIALHEIGSRLVPTKSQPTTSWDQPRAVETLEALVNQATLQPYCKTKTNAPLNDEELVPTDAMVPSSYNRTGEAPPSVKSARDAGWSTHVSSCRSMDPGPRVDMSMSGNFVSPGNLGDRRLTMGSPEHSSSRIDFSNSMLTASYHRNQQEKKAANEKKIKKPNSSILNKRRRTAAIHNQSERNRRDKINQKLKTLQKLVPNSNKTDKVSMLEEVIEHIKQLQLQLHTTNMMNLSPMMMSLVMQQQQLQLQKSMLNPMGTGMGLGIGMGIGMGGMDLNSISPSNIPGCFHPSAFVPMPSWNNPTADQVNTNTMAGGPMSAFLAARSQQPNVDYSRMAALYQQMQNQPCGPFPKN